MKSIRILLLAIVILAALMPLASCFDVASPLEDYHWVLLRYGNLNDSKTPLDGTEITALFDSKTKTVTGSGGVNTYSAPYATDHLNLKITGPITRTAISGGTEKDAQETEFFKELAGATGFMMDHGQLSIQCGDTRLLFQQTDVKLKTITHWGE